jgi:hypothetical protein
MADGELFDRSAALIRMPQMPQIAQIQKRSRAARSAADRSESPDKMSPGSDHEGLIFQGSLFGLEAGLRPAARMLGDLPAAGRRQRSN